jgi:hypothetical protein
MRSKGLMKGKSIRDVSFDLLNNPALSLNYKEQQLYKSCQERLDRVLSKAGDMTSDTIPEDAQTFENFCVKHSAWADKSNSFVFHRDHPTVHSHQRKPQGKDAGLHGKVVIGARINAVGKR